MTNTFTKVFLSGSANGKMVSVSGSMSPGTIIHTAVSGSTEIDEIWLQPTNGSDIDILLTMQWGGLSDADKIVATIQPQSGLNQVIPGWPLNNGLIVRAYATTISGCPAAGAINIGGFVNRVTPA
jgi:hypothetical protein